MDINSPELHTKIKLMSPEFYQNCLFYKETIYGTEVGWVIDNIENNGPNGFFDLHGTGIDTKYFYCCFFQSLYMNYFLLTFTTQYISNLMCSYSLRFKHKQRMLKFIEQINGVFTPFMCHDNIPNLSHLSPREVFKNHIITEM
jgi:hypothetical protein